MPERNSRALVSPPYSLVATLASRHLLSSSTDVKVKHGVLGLLKHLAQAPPSSTIIQNALRGAEIIQKIAESGVWDEKGDAMADVVQLSAIGVVKHMAGANGIANFLSATPIAHILYSGACLCTCLAFHSNSRTSHRSLSGACFS